MAWHQDYSYWTRTRPMAHLTCFIALDDTDLENGCLHHVPGTHRWPLCPLPGLAGDMDEIQTVLSDEQRRGSGRFPRNSSKGEASFHHPLPVTAPLRIPPTVSAGDGDQCFPGWRRLGLGQAAAQGPAGNPRRPSTVWAVFSTVVRPEASGFGHPQGVLWTGILRLN